MLLSILSKYSYFKPVFNNTIKGLWKRTLIRQNCDTLMCFHPSIESVKVMRWRDVEVFKNPNREKGMPCCQQKVPPSFVSPYFCPAPPTPLPPLFMSQFGGEDPSEKNLQTKTLNTLKVITRCIILWVWEVLFSKVLLLQEQDGQT